MKRLFLFTMIIAAGLYACTKDDNGDNPPKRQAIETEAISNEADFKHLTLDSAYVMALDWQMKDLCELEGIQEPAIDFSVNGVIVVTGIAPAEVESFLTEMYDENGVQTLNINAKVIDPEYVKPCKWNLMLKIPQQAAQKTNCNITYDMQFDAAQVPDVSYVLPTYENGKYYTRLEEIPVIEKAYLVVIETSKLDKLKAAVNADAECIMIDNPTPFHGHLTGLFTSYLAPISPADCKGVFLKNCDYEKVIAPMKEDILYICQGGYNGYWDGNTPGYWFYAPAIGLALKADTDTKLIAKLAENLGLNKSDIKIGTSDNPYDAWFYFNKNSKVNALQFSYMLCVAGYLEPAEYRQFYTINKNDFDSAVKQVYE